MIAYLDASVVLRLVLGEAEPLREWSAVQRGVASALTEVECLRTLDRLAHADRIPAHEVATRRVAIYQLLEAVEVVGIAPQVLRRASQSFPTPLGTLDAIHLATAMSWRDARGLELAIATHDKALALAARATGFQVLGD